MNVGTSREILLYREKHVGATCNVPRSLRLPANSSQFAIIYDPHTFRLCLSLSHTHTHTHRNTHTHRQTQILAYIYLYVYKYFVVEWTFLHATRFIGSRESINASYSGYYVYREWCNDSCSNTPPGQDIVPKRQVNLANTLTVQRKERFFSFRR